MLGHGVSAVSSDPGESGPTQRGGDCVPGSRLKGGGSPPLSQWEEDKSSIRWDKTQVSSSCWNFNVFPAEGTAY